MDENEQLMKHHGVRPTSNRMIILRILREALSPLSLMEVEALAESIDKSTISRTLNHFREASLVHSLEDATGITRYELCTSHTETDDDTHIHFFCTHCQQLTCLHHYPLPLIALPAGYTQQSASFIIKGLCPRCAKRQ